MLGWRTVHEMVCLEEEGAFAYLLLALEDICDSAQGRNTRNKGLWLEDRYRRHQRTALT